MVNLYIDNSLDMPLGKLCSQVSHGVMKLILDRFYLKSGFLVSDVKKDVDWINSFFKNMDINLIYLDDFDKDRKELNQPGTYALIEDQGRTCFGGVKTATVMAHTLESLSPSKREIEPIKSESTLVEARQIILVDKNRTLSLTDDEIIKGAARASLLNLFSYADFIDDGLIVFDIRHKGALYDWLIGSFAKITLTQKGEARILQSLNALGKLEIPYSEVNVLDETKIYSFGPCRKELSIPITKKMRLL